MSPPTLEVTDSLTQSTLSTGQHQPASVGITIDSELDQANEIRLNPSALDTIDLTGNFKGPNDRPNPIASNSYTQITTTATHPGHYAVEDEIVNYGSCVSEEERLNHEDEADTPGKKPFVAEGICKLSKDLESPQSDYQRVDWNESKVRWWRHPRFKENWKIFFSAFGLLVFGIGLIAMGILVSVLPDIDFQSYVFFIAGAICFIPGAYHVVYLYFAVTGRKGYDFHQLPLFN